MTIFSKPVIFSALIFPGSGYFFLNRPKQAMAFMLSTLSCLLVVFYDAYYKAQIIAEKIIDGYLPIDIQSIQQEILTTQGVISPSVITALSFIIGGLWLFGIIDCYRIGRSQKP